MRDGLGMWCSSAKMLRNRAVLLCIEASGRRINNTGIGYARIEIVYKKKIDPHASKVTRFKVKIPRLVNLLVIFHGALENCRSVVAGTTHRDSVCARS